MLSLLCACCGVSRGDAAGSRFKICARPEPLLLAKSLKTRPRGRRALEEAVKLDQASVSMAVREGPNSAGTKMASRALSCPVEALDKRGLSSREPEPEEGSESCCSRSSARFHTLETRDRMPQDEEQRVVAEIEAFAALVEGVVLKFPRRGMSLLTRPRSRYVAAVKTTLPPRRGILLTEHQRWVLGSLSYWESEHEFRAGREPKGSVPLRFISKVQAARERGMVTVKHKMEESAHELVLLFDDRRRAEEWSFALWSVLAKLREAPLPHLDA